MRTPPRPFAFLIAAVYFAFTCVLGHAAESNVWSERRRFRENRSTASPLQMAALPPALLADFSLPLSSSSRAASLPQIPELDKLFRVLPSSLGQVRGVRLPAGAPRLIVLHIQDVHLNLEAQKHTAAAVQNLLDAGAVGLLALEGAFGPIDLSRYRDFPERDVTRRVADYLLREGKISGPVHTAFVSRAPVPVLVGVDDPAHYRANVQAYLDARALTAGVREELSRERRELEAAKARAFSPALARFDGQVQDYRAGRMALGDFAQALAINAAPSKPGTNLARLLEALALEKSLDLGRVQDERARLLETLTARLSHQDVSDLIARSAAYRAGHLGHAAFYSHLESLARAHGAPLDGLPHMKKYVRYLLKADAIRPDGLYDELAALEDRSYENLARTAAESALVARSRAHVLKEKLAGFALSRAEWKQYQALAPEGRAASPFENFYREALIRDEKISKNFLNAAAGLPKEKIAVLVSGGFHADGIDARLEAAGCAVVSFVPRLTKIDTASGSAYLSVFAQEKTPLEKMFQGEKLFVEPDPVNVAQAPFGYAALSPDHRTALAHFFGGGRIEILETERTAGGDLRCTVRKAGDFGPVNVVVRVKDGNIEAIDNAPAPARGRRLSGWARYVSPRLVAACQVLVLLPVAAFSLLTAPPKAQGQTPDPEKKSGPRKAGAQKAAASEAEQVKFVRDVLARVAQRWEYLGSLGDRSSPYVERATMGGPEKFRRLEPRPFIDYLSRRVVVTADIDPARPFTVVLDRDPDGNIIVDPKTLVPEARLLVHPAGIALLKWLRTVPPDPKLGEWLPRVEDAFIHEASINLVSAGIYDRLGYPKGDLDPMEVRHELGRSEVFLRRWIEARIQQSRREGTRYPGKELADGKPGDDRSFGGLIKAYMELTVMLGSPGIYDAMSELSYDGHGKGGDFQGSLLPLLDLLPSCERMAGPGAARALRSLIDELAEDYYAVTAANRMWRGAPGMLAGPELRGFIEMVRMRAEDIEINMGRFNTSAYFNYLSDNFESYEYGPVRRLSYQELLKRFGPLLETKKPAAPNSIASAVLTWMKGRGIIDWNSAAIAWVGLIGVPAEAWLLGGFVWQVGVGFPQPLLAGLAAHPWAVAFLSAGMSLVPLALFAWLHAWLLRSGASGFRAHFYGFAPYALFAGVGALWSNFPVAYLIGIFMAYHIILDLVRQRHALALSRHRLIAIGLMALGFGFWSGWLTWNAAVRMEQDLKRPRGFEAYLNKSLADQIRRLRNKFHSAAPAALGTSPEIWDNYALLLQAERLEPVDPVDFKSSDDYPENYWKAVEKIRDAADVLLNASFWLIFRQEEDLSKMDPRARVLREMLHATDMPGDAEKVTIVSYGPEGHQREILVSPMHRSVGSSSEPKRARVWAQGNLAIYRIAKDKVLFITPETGPMIIRVLPESSSIPIYYDTEITFLTPPPAPPQAVPLNPMPAQPSRPLTPQVPAPGLAAPPSPVKKLNAPQKPQADAGGTRRGFLAALFGAAASQLPAQTPKQTPRPRLDPAAPRQADAQFVQNIVGALGRDIWGQFTLGAFMQMIGGELGLIKDVPARYSKMTAAAFFDYLSRDGNVEIRRTLDPSLPFSLELQRAPDGNLIVDPETLVPRAKLLVHPDGVRLLRWLGAQSLDAEEISQMSLLQSSFVMEPVFMLMGISAYEHMGVMRGDGSGPLELGRTERYFKDQIRRHMALAQRRGLRHPPVVEGEPFGELVKGYVVLMTRLTSPGSNRGIDAVALAFAHLEDKYAIARAVERIGYRARGALGGAAAPLEAMARKVQRDDSIQEAVARAWTASATLFGDAGFAMSVRNMAEDLEVAAGRFRQTDYLNYLSETLVPTSDLAYGEIIKRFPPAPPQAKPAPKAKPRAAIFQVFAAAGAALAAMGLVEGKRFYDRVLETAGEIEDALAARQAPEYAERRKNILATIPGERERRAIELLYPADPASKPMTMEQIGADLSSPGSTVGKGNVSMIRGVAILQAAARATRVKIYKTPFPREAPLKEFLDYLQSKHSKMKSLRQQATLNDPMSLSEESIDLESGPVRKLVRNLRQAVREHEAGGSRERPEFLGGIIPALENFFWELADRDVSVTNDAQKNSVYIKWTVIGEEVLVGLKTLIPLGLWHLLSWFALIPGLGDGQWMYFYIGANALFVLSHLVLQKHQPLTVSRALNFFAAMLIAGIKVQAVNYFSLGLIAGLFIGLPVHWVTNKFLNFLYEQFDVYHLELEKLGRSFGVTAQHWSRHEIAPRRGWRGARLGILIAAMTALSFQAPAAARAGMIVESNLGPPVLLGVDGRLELIREASGMEGSAAFEDALRAQARKLDLSAAPTAEAGIALQKFAAYGMEEGARENTEIFLGRAAASAAQKPAALVLSLVRPEDADAAAAKARAAYELAGENAGRMTFIFVSGAKELEASLKRKLRGSGIPVESCRFIKENVFDLTGEEKNLLGALHLSRFLDALAPADAARLAESTLWFILHNTHVVTDGLPEDSFLRSALFLVLNTVALEFRNLDDIHKIARLIDTAA